MKTTKAKFKQTELGLIPQDWEVVKIDEVLDKIIDYRGKTPKKSGSGIKTLSAKSIKNGRIDYDQTYFISHETFRGWEKRGTPNVGDVLLTTEGPLGEVAQLDKRNVAIAQRLLTLRGKEGELDNSYLKYVLMSPMGQQELLSRSTGTTVQGIKQSEFRKILIAKPPFESQNAIAKILSDLDSKIELNRRINKILDAISRAIFKHWFIEFEFPNDEGKPYKSSNGKMIDSKLGKIPEGWTVSDLAEHVSVVKGCSYRSAELRNSEIALVTLRSINRGGGFNQDGYKEYVGEYDESQVVKDGEIVVAQTDLTQKAEVIGRPAIVNSQGRYSKLVASLDLQIVRPKDDFSRNYAYYLLRTEEFHNHALSLTNGTTVLHLDKNAVPKFKAAVPSGEELDRFDSVIESALTRIIVDETEILTLSRIRDSL